MQALKHLSVVAVIRLDEKPDRIENILISALSDAPVAKVRGTSANTDPLASSSWEEVLFNSSELLLYARNKSCRRA